MVSKRAILLVVLALMFHLRATSQETCDFILSGTVVDELNQPVVAATVFVTSHNLGTTTDLNGDFSFAGICAGKVVLKVMYLGYEDVRVEINMKGDHKKHIRLVPKVTELNEVIIQHHDETHTEHVQHIHILEERALSEVAGKSLGETLKAVSGVSTVQTGPGIFKPVIHGVHSQRILILNHGIRHEGQQWGAEHAPEIDPFIASNIVVVKDASAIKYGTDGLGGVIIVNPAALPERAGLGGTVHVVGQSNGRGGAVAGMLEGGVKNHQGWGWRIQGTQKRLGDFSSAEYNLTNTGISESNYSAAAGYHKERFGADIFFSHFNSNIGILKGTAIGNPEDLFDAMQRDVPLGTEPFSYTIKEPRQAVAHNLIKLNGHISTEAGEWRVQYGFQNNNRQEFSVRKGGQSNRPTLDLQLNTHILDTEWETHHSEKRSFSFGLNTLYQENENIYGTQRIPFIPNFMSVSSGGFAIAKFYFQSFTLDLGTRYDWRYYSVKGFDTDNNYYAATYDFNNLSASVGTTYSVDPKQNFRLNISSAWRPPHVAELYSAGTHQSAASIEYGLLLDKETNRVLDINTTRFGIEQALKSVLSYEFKGEQLSFSVTPYANYIFNYIFLKPSGVTTNLSGTYPYLRYSQTDALFVGSDLALTWKPHQHVKIIPQATLLRAKDVTNDDMLVFIPPNSASMDIRYERPHWLKWHHVYIEASTRFVARQDRSPRILEEPLEANEDPFANDKSSFDFKEPPNAYALVNLAAGFSIEQQKTQFDFRISCENVLNQSYRDYMNRLRYFADNPGRNIAVSVKCIF